MGQLDEIEPKGPALIMDLVRQAGVDVSDWANMKGGAARAAANPKYCYEWSFIDKARGVVVLNLWFDEMSEQDGAVMWNMSLREVARRLSAFKPVWGRRAYAMDRALQYAVRECLPVRVIVCAGDRREPSVHDATASKVAGRALDPEAWSIADYDWETGMCRLVRGVHISLADQFSFDERPRGVEYRDASGRVAVRRAEVRMEALRRSGGNCEWCGAPGFELPTGERYLETHHVVPLSEGGPDEIGNVVALCPNHHREAHYGTDRVHLRASMLKIAAAGGPQVERPSR